MSDLINRFEALGMADANLSDMANRMESDAKRIAELCEQIESMQRENVEQARLLGISAERELRLQARIAELRRLLKKASGEMSHGRWSSDFRKEVETALKTAAPEVVSSKTEQPTLAADADERAKAERDMQKIGIGFLVAGKHVPSEQVQLLLAVNAAQDVLETIRHEFNSRGLLNTVADRDDLIMRVREILAAAPKSAQQPDSKPTCNHCLQIQHKDCEEWLANLPDGIFATDTWTIARIAWNAALARCSDGFALVPLTPTPAMLDVAVSFALNVKLSSEYNWSQYMTDVWARMVGAAMAQGEKQQ